MDAEAPERRDQFRLIRGEVDAPVGDDLVLGAAERVPAPVAGRGLERKLELRLAGDRHGARGVHHAGALGHERLVVHQQRRDLRATEGGRPLRVEARVHQHRRAPHDGVVLEDVVRAVDEHTRAVAGRSDRRARDRRHARVGEVVERVLPSVEVVLNGDRAPERRGKGEGHSAGATVDRRGDHGNAVHQHHHVGGVGGGDATVVAVHDGAVERVEHPVAGCRRARDEPDHAVRRPAADDDRDVGRETDAGRAEVVHERARDERSNARRAVQRRRDNRRRERPDREAHGHFREPVHRELELVGASRERVALPDAAVEDRRRAGDLRRHVVRDARVRALEVVGAEDEVRREREVGNLDNAGRPVDPEDHRGLAVDRDRERGRVRRRRARAVPVDDGVVLDLKAIDRAVERAEADQTAGSNAHHGTPRLVLVDDLLIDRGRATANHAEVRLRENLRTRADERRDERRDRGDGWGNAEESLRVDSRRGVATREDAGHGVSV